MTDIVKMESRAEKRERLLSRENLEKVAMQVAVAKALYAWAKKEQDEVGNLLENGESHKVLNSRGVQVSTISKSNPQPQFVIKDMAAVLPAALDQGREVVDLLPQEGTEEYYEAVEVLLEHAPGLVRTVLSEVDEEAMRDDVKAEWEVTGKVPIGWEVKEGRPGFASVRPTPVGKKIVERALDDMKGLLELEGRNDE